MKTNSTKKLQVMAYLRQNGRIGLTELSRRTGIPVSTIFDQIKAMESGVIKRFTALLNPEVLGFAARAFVLLKTENGKKEELIAHLSKNEKVNLLCRINNGWDIFFECICRNMKEVEDFVYALETNFNVQRKEIHYIIEELRRESWLADPKLIFGQD